ncbi:MAG: neutral/alkaline non-lysosomal ceramidase N-terminal domain-containing protein [Verrucomicrobia bacterium]|nr:neutral/alkaline non-lysosomal ceramidase N-terminal domain-containing protein [Verrucomicrobiota bacterium]
MRIQKTFQWLLCLGFVFTSIHADAQTPAAKKPRVFKAGAAASNITPFIGAGIVGGFTTPPSTHIHDELHARCLALDDGETRLAFAIVDSVSVNREVFDEAKRLVSEATGLPRENMMMSATHTHSASSARGTNAFVFEKSLDDYQSFLARRIADGVRRALNNLQPARIGWGAGQVPQHVFNRRWLLKDGKTSVNPFGEQDRAVMNPGNRPDLLKPAGPTNSEVYFISVESTNGRPIALLANYWLHYVGGVGNGHISADYFGVFCDRIQELLGADRQDPPFVGVLANGPCGDVNNINFTAPREKHAPYEKMKIVANDVAQEVLRVRKTIRHRDWVELKSAQAELELKMRHPTPEMLARAQQILARPATISPAHRLEGTYASRTVAAAKWPESISIVLQTFRIGDLGIAAVPFETFTETGLEIKAKSPFKDTFTIELANGGYGYLPTPEQHELGGYETWLGTNRVEKDATRKIMAKLMELFARLK